MDSSFFLPPPPRLRLVLLGETETSLLGAADGVKEADGLVELGAIFALAVVVDVVVLVGVEGTAAPEVPETSLLRPFLTISAHLFSLGGDWTTFSSITSE